MDSSTGALNPPAPESGCMEGFKNRGSPRDPTAEPERREALSVSKAALRKEGFAVSATSVADRAPGGVRPELVATNGSRIVQVLVLLDSEVDSEKTRERLRRRYRLGETRVFVRWPLRWRMLSNVARWGLRGVAVSTW